MNAAKLPPVSRDFLIKVAEASEACNDPRLVNEIQKLKDAGRYGDATNEEVDLFDVVFDEAEDRL